MLCLIWHVWPKFGPQKLFLWVLTLLDARDSCRLSLYAIARKTNDPNSRTWWKTSFWAWFRPAGPKFRLLFFSPKIWLCQSLDIVANYHHVQIRKTNDPILRKLSDWLTDGGDFTECCPTNCPTIWNFRIKHFIKLNRKKNWWKNWFRCKSVGLLGFKLYLGH